MPGPNAQAEVLEKANGKLIGLQDIARAHEVVNEQMKSMDRPLAHRPGQVNSIKQQKFQNKGRGQSEIKGRKGWKSHKPWKPKTDQSQRCYNCNPFGHCARDACCPARDKECGNCRARVHFVVCCWKKGAIKAPPRANQERSRKVYHVEEGATGRGDGYAFMVKGQQETGEITLNVSGVLIDSGASSNLID